MTTADLSDNDSGTVAQVSFTTGRGVTVVTYTKRR
jgi:nucleoside 2-deoxyribosyltransferase